MSFSDFIINIIGAKKSDTKVKERHIQGDSSDSLYSENDIVIDENHKISAFDDGTVLGYNGLNVEEEEETTTADVIENDKKNKTKEFGIAAFCITAATIAIGLITRKKINAKKLKTGMEVAGNKIQTTGKSVSTTKTQLSRIADSLGISHNAKIKKSLLKDEKNTEQKEILNNLLNKLMEHNFDLGTVQYRSVYNHFAEVIQHSPNPKEFTNTVAEVLLKHKDNEVVFHTLETYLIHANGENNIKTDTLIKFFNSVKESDISSEHLFSILAHRKSSLRAKRQGDPLDLVREFNFNQQEWESLGKILPILAKSKQTSRLNLDALDIVKWSNDLKSLPEKLSPGNKQELLKTLAEASEMELAEMQAAGVNVHSLKNYLSFYLSNPGIKINTSEMPLYFRRILNKNTEQIILDAKTESLISKYAATGIPLNYPRNAFVNDLNSSIRKLGENEQKTLLKQLEITLNENDFNGIINPDKINLEAFDISVRPIVQEIKNATQKFVRENAFICDTPEITGFLNDIKTLCPEFMSMAGKTVQGQAKTLECEVLEILDNAIKNPMYKYLKDDDKLILKMSVLFQSLGKTANINELGLSYKLSSMLTKNVIEKYRFRQEIEERILNQISNGDFWVRNNVIFDNYFRLENDRRIAEILSQSTAKVLEKDYTTPIRKGGHSLKATYACINPSAGKKYPKIKYTIDNKTYEIPVLDVRNMSPETDMTPYGYIGMKLKDITVQVHNTEIHGMESLARAYKDPNYYYALSTSIRHITNRRNGYGYVGYILSTSKMNRGGGKLTAKLDGVGDIDDFMSQSWLDYGRNKRFPSHENIYPGQIKNPKEREAWFGIANDAGNANLNELFALRPKPEQIALGEGIACTSTTIPEEYVRLSVENGCMPILLTK